MAAAVLLALSASAMSGVAQAATTGTAEFNADIEAVVNQKCEVSVAVDDPVVSAATYRKGKDGQLGELKLTKTGESILTVKATGAHCNLDNYRLVPEDKPSMGSHVSYAATKNGLLWPVDFVWSHIVVANLENDLPAKNASVKFIDGATTRPLLTKRPRDGWRAGTEYSNPNLSGHSGYGDGPRYIFTGTASAIINASAATFTTGKNASGNEPAVLVVGTDGVAELKFALSSLIGKYPYDPATKKPDDSKLEDGEEVVFTRALTVVAP